MLKTLMTFLKKGQSARVLCALALVLLPVLLSGCSEISDGSQGEEAARVEKETMDCWLCPLFEMGFNIADQFSKSLVQSVSKSAVSLLGVGFGLWLAIFILKFVGSMKEPDTYQYWRELASQAFLATLVAAMLRDLGAGSGSSVLKMIVEPVFSGFVDTGLMIINASGSDLPCSPGGGPKSGMICLITALQGKLNISIGFSYLAIIAGPTIFIILVGAGIYLVSIFMMIYFPLLLLDCVIRYCFIVAMLPLCLTAFCFKATRNFSAKGMEMLVQIGFGTVGMCVFCAVAVEVIKKYMDAYLPYMTHPLDMLSDPSLFQNAIFGPGIIGLIFIFTFLIFFADVILDLMQSFSGGAGGLGKTAAGTYSDVKGGAKLGAKIGKFAANRGLRHWSRQDMKAKEALEAKQASGQKLSDKEQKRLDRANENLQDRGYLAKGADGQLHKTQAYTGLKNSAHNGVRNWAAGVAQDWNSGPLSQSVDRHDHGKDGKGGNKASDNYKGALDED